MRILIFSYQSVWPWHWETALELAENHLLNGDAVEFFSCDACVEACDGNPEKDKLKCSLCQARRTRGRSLLSGYTEEHFLSRYISKEVLADEEFRTGRIEGPASAKDFMIDGHDLGWGAYSSMISASRDHLCETERSVRLLKNFSSTAYRTYFGVKNFLQTQPAYDIAYIFNGRFASTRAALRACQDSDSIARVEIHERGSSKDKYELFGDKLPHDREAISKRLINHWNSADQAERITKGKAFFDDRRKRQNTDWISFTAKQTHRKLPTDFNPLKQNIAIFNSSEDEIAGIGEQWSNPIYKSQSEAIKQIVTDIHSSNPEIHFYLRIHPNLTDVTGSEMTQILSLQSPNLSIIPANSDICTYELIDSCEKTLCFGSTVGVEATYHNRPSIVAGLAWYDSLDAAYYPRSHKEVLNLLTQPLSPKPQEEALKYGYYHQTFGRNFKHCSAKSLFSITFKETDLRQNNTTEKLLFRTFDALGFGGYRARALLSRMQQKRAEAKLQRLKHGECLKTKPKIV